MSFEDLVKSARSYRRFSAKPLPQDFLHRMVSYARFSPSSKNLQFLKYMIVSSEKGKNALFPVLKWAGALTEWDGPSEGERPQGYIVILLDKSLSPNPSCDHGIVAQTMQLGAAEEGVGCCMIGSFGKSTLSQVLDLPEDLTPCLVLAFGYPGETILLEDASNPENVIYYRDSSDVHHVPKRPLSELIAGEK